MIKLLEGPAGSVRKSSTNAYATRLFTFMHENEVNATRYYRNAKLTSKGNHILATLINSILVPVSMDAERYAVNVATQGNQIMRSLGIGTVTSPAKITQRGEFYGLPEILIGEAEEPRQYKTWHKYRPIKVMYHPRTDVTYTLLDGTPNTDEAGFAVIYINVSELMLMYKGWRLFTNRIYPDNPPTVPEFVQSWVLPSMMESHNAQAMLNRTKCDLLGFAIPSENKRTPFKTPRNDYLDKSYREWLISKLESMVPDWLSILQLTQMTEIQNLESYCKIPDLVPTHHGKGMMLLASLSTLNYLLMASMNSAVSGVKANSVSSQQLIKMLRRFGSERWFADPKTKHLIEKWVNDNIASLLME